MHFQKHKFQVRAERPVFMVQNCQKYLVFDRSPADICALTLGRLVFFISSDIFRRRCLTDRTSDSYVRGKEKLDASKNYVGLAADNRAWLGSKDSAGCLSLGPNYAH